MLITIRWDLSARFWLPMNLGSLAGVSERFGHFLDLTDSRSSCKRQVAEFMNCF
jgi:hypothetical protein